MPGKGIRLAFRSSLDLWILGKARAVFASCSSLMCGWVGSNTVTMSEETTGHVDAGNDSEAVGTSVEPTGDPERPDSASSSASSLVSETSVQDEDTELFERPQQSQNQGPEKVAADVSARGILKYKRKLSSDTAFRGLLMSACAKDEVGNATEQAAGPSDAQPGIAEEPPQALEEQPKPLTKRPSSVSSTSTVPSEENETVSVKDVKVSGDSVPQNEVELAAGKSEGNDQGSTSVSGSTTVKFVTACTQTEWSWLQDSLLYQELIHRESEWPDGKVRRMSVGSVGKICFLSAILQYSMLL